MRYCLDMDRGYVILMSFDAEPRAEIVNRTLADDKLVEYLKARDPYAFAQPDSWWSMVFEQVG